MDDSIASSAPGCLYVEQAAPGPAFPTLERNLDVDVAVVGGGFTGLSTALHLREAGVDVAVLEAREPGWGASGRNGGQVNPGLKREPAEILEMFGQERGERLIRLSGTAPDYVFELIQRHNIDCDQSRLGSIRVVRTEKDVQLIEKAILSWRTFGAHLTFLDRAELERLIGTSVYPAGLLDPRSGSINPLSYARGLASAVVQLGGMIFSGTPALRIERHGRAWQLVVPNASVRANSVVLATNGYTDDLWPGLKQTVIPIYSAIAATPPLPANLRSKILPAGEVVYESSWRVLYFRVDSQGHLLMGGPSVHHSLGTNHRYDYLARYALALFPDLAGMPWPYAWTGQVAVTSDHLPHFHEPAPGIYAALGYNGRGIAMATAMGRILCRRILGASVDELELPVTPVNPIWFHPFWRPIVSIVGFQHTLIDRVRGLA